MQPLERFTVGVGEDRTEGGASWGWWRAENKIQVQTEDSEELRGDSRHVTRAAEGKEVRFARNSIHMAMNVHFLLVPHLVLCLGSVPPAADNSGRAEGQPHAEQRLTHSLYPKHRVSKTLDTTSVPQTQNTRTEKGISNFSGDIWPGTIG